jgi:hypothetical protein
MKPNKSYNLSIEEMNAAYACAQTLQRNGLATIKTEHIEAVQQFIWDVMKIKTLVWQNLHLLYEKNDAYFLEQV